MRNCQNCGRDMGFVTRRRKFCSDKCRVQFNRSHAPAKLYSDAMRAISLLGQAKYGDKTNAKETLKQLRTAIDFELRRLGDSDTIYRYEMLEGRTK